MIDYSTKIVRTSDDGSIVTYQLTKDEALKFIKRHRRGRRCLMHCGVFLPTNDNRGFDGMCNVPISFRDARKAIEDLLRNLGERGAHIRISMSERLIFVG